MDGWISLHRKFLNWEWYDDINTKSLFIHCLLKANHIKKIWRGIKIDSGQFFTSTGHLSNELNLTIKQVRISIDKLKSTGEIITKGANNGTMISVCNYESYQDITKLKGKRGASEGQARGKRGAITNKDNKDNKDNKGKLYLTLLDFEEMRNKLKKPLTERAKELLIINLNKLSSNEKTQILILEQSIINSWQGVFPLNENNNKIDRQKQLEEQAKRTEAKFKNQ